MFNALLESLSIPTFTLPSFVARIGRKLPQWPHALAFVVGLNTLTKAKLFPEDTLALLEGRTFQVDILDVGNCISFSFRDGLFRPLFTAPETPDLVFRASLSTFLQLATRQEDPDTLFFNRTLIIEGDAELGRVVKNIFDTMKWRCGISGHNALEPVSHPPFASAPQPKPVHGDTSYGRDRL